MTTPERIEKFFQAMRLRLPSYWAFDQVHYSGFVYEHTLTPQRVIISPAPTPDGLAWIHFSLSCRGRIPSWEELKAAKEHFLGDVHAYQVLPPKAEYVNIHPHVLHLWHCIDKNPFPDWGDGAAL